MIKVPVLFPHRGLCSSALALKLSQTLSTLSFYWPMCNYISLKTTPLSSFNTFRAYLPLFSLQPQLRSWISLFKLGALLIIGPLKIYYRVTAVWAPHCTAPRRFQTFNPQCIRQNRTHCRSSFCAIILACLFPISSTEITLSIEDFYFCRETGYSYNNNFNLWTCDKSQSFTERHCTSRKWETNQFS